VDWRQLQRWGISRSRVPAGTLILFREPGVWGRYRTYIIGVLVLLLTQSALITGLLVQVARRRRAEEEIRASQRELHASYERIRHLSGRLLSAHDAERTRIARELYDDISQKTALLLIDLQMLSGIHRTPDGDANERFDGVLERGQDIARSLHDLSHRLHPAKLGLMGLVPALHGLQREFTSGDVAVTLSCDDDVAAATLPHELTLTIYRAVQEGVRNAVKHSGAKDVVVELRAAPGLLFLTVSDKGVGFDVNAQWGRGLGLISMRERVAVVGGTLNIRAVPGGGTRLEISVPCDAMRQRSHVVEVRGKDLVTRGKATCITGR